MIPYQPTIDGLRAIAVLAVCIYHLSNDWLPGGFVGVDIFFVISGYLITSIVASECEHRRFSFSRFYQRRIARILPASLLTALISLALACFIYNSMDAASAGALAAASISGLANIKLLLQGNYFDASLDAQPFLHYWSLSLEEQFYLLYPALYAFLYSSAPRAKTAVLLGLLCVSFVSCVVTTPLSASAAFYLLPTRAWELLAGCVIASEQHDRRIKASVAWAGIAGAALLITALLITPHGNDFPGLWPVLPVAGTALLLCHINSKSWLNGFLAAPAMTAIGRISYSLYLWHWPIFSFVDYSMPFASEVSRVALKCGWTAAASHASFSFIEKPCRNWLNAQGRFATAVISLVVAIVVGVGFGSFVRREFYVNATPRDSNEAGRAFVVRANGPTVVLAGDSHASMYARSMRNACKTAELNLTVLSADGQNPLPTSLQPNPVWDLSIREIRRLRPEVVVLACDWRRRFADDPKALDVALREILAVSGRVIIVAQPPRIPEKATRAAIRGGSRPPFFEDSADRADRLAINRTLSRVAANRCQVIDAAALFESNDGAVAWQDDLGRQLFQDRSHLSGVGADRVIATVMSLICSSTP